MQIPAHSCVYIYIYIYIYTSWPTRPLGVAWDERCKTISNIFSSYSIFVLILGGLYGMGAFKYHITLFWLFAPPPYLTPFSCFGYCPSYHHSCAWEFKLRVNLHYILASFVFMAFFYLVLWLCGKVWKFG